MKIIRVILAFAFTFLAVTFAVFMFNRMGMNAYALQKFITMKSTVDATQKDWEVFAKRNMLENADRDRGPTTPIEHLMFAGAYSCQEERVLRRSGEDHRYISEEKAEEYSQKVLNELLAVEDCPSLVKTKEDYFENFISYRLDPLKKEQHKKKGQRVVWHSLILDSIDKMYVMNQLKNVGWTGAIQLRNGKNMLKLSDMDCEKLLKIAYRLQEYGQEESARSILRAGAYRDFILQTTPGNENHESKFAAALINLERFHATQSDTQKYHNFLRTFNWARILGMYGLSLCAICLIISLIMGRKRFVVFAVVYLLMAGVFVWLRFAFSNEFHNYCNTVLSPGLLSFEEFTIMPNDKECTAETILQAIHPTASLENDTIVQINTCPIELYDTLVRHLETVKEYNPYLFGETAAVLYTGIEGIEDPATDTEPDSTASRKNGIKFHFSRTNQPGIYSIDLNQASNAPPVKRIPTFLWDSQKLTLTPLEW